MRESVIFINETLSTRPIESPHAVDIVALKQLLPSLQSVGKGGGLNVKTLTLSPKSKNAIFPFRGGGVGGGGVNVKTLTLSPKSKNVIFPFWFFFGGGGEKCCAKSEASGKILTTFCSYTEILRASQIVSVRRLITLKQKKTIQMKQYPEDKNFLVC